MVKILDEVLKLLPSEAKISEACFEGSNIVVYTKNKEYFVNPNDSIKKVVDNIKKRVELRADTSLILDQDEAKKIIKKTIPEEAGVTNVLFDQQRSMVIIEAEKPGLAIGKGGELLRELKKEILWVPLVRRVPAIRSPLIENIRSVLYENSDYRKKFLNDVGKRIYSGWIRGKKEGWVRMSILGAGREVGRSCFLLQTPESRVLIDCGINVASEEHAFPHLDAPEVNIQEIDAVVISHAHLDHIGFLPYLFKYGYRGPVYMTGPTRDIGALLALDYISLAQKEAKESAYTTTDVKNMVLHTITLDYEEVSDITPDVRLTLYNAGHNLGSSLIHMHIGNGLHNLLYTGDYNFETSNLLASAITKFPRLETVMTEATYGSHDDVTKSRDECEDDLINLINDTLKNKGKVLLPTLGVGRSQEIMLILERAVREGKISRVPIYLHGMLWDVTAIHTAYPDFFNKQVKKSIFQKDENPLLSDVFKKVGSHEEMKQVINSGDSCIIMATSGMLTGGASLEYFKALSENPKNTLVLTCYQGEGSLGRRLQNNEKEIIFVEGGSRKQEVNHVKMGIHTISGFSGHSNFNQLINFFKRLEPRPKKIIINHGESSKCLEFASTLHQMLRVETIAPRNLEAVRLK